MSSPGTEPLLLQGKVALITGGSRGLGAAIARVFTQHGATGAVVDVTDAAAPPGWASVTADVTDETDVERAVSETLSRFGHLDIVVANAGVVPVWSATAELDLAALDRTLAVNVRGVAATLKHGSRGLVDGGSIVVTASLNAWRAAPAQASYTASKHAVLGLARTAALDLGARGIRVNAIAPGPIATEALLERMSRRAEGGGLALDAALEQATRGTALGRMATEDEVAATALFLASGLSSGITGACIPVDAGIL